jgi:hypothetical protein
VVKPPNLVSSVWQFDRPMKKWVRAIDFCVFFAIEVSLSKVTRHRHRILVQQRAPSHLR